MKINDLGLLEYYTKLRGIKGSVKTFPEDFVVREVTPRNFVCNEDYSFSEKFYDSFFFLRKRKKYVRATLVKKDYSTLKCVSTIEMVLRTRVGFAGIKDKRAVTSQRISIPSDKFRKVNFKGFFLKNLEYNHNRIAPGNLSGNFFEIIVRDFVGNPEIFFDELRDNNLLLPNFFGVQRFGSGRNTHLIGLNLLRKDYSSAAGELLRSDGFIERKFKRNVSKGYERAFKSLGFRILNFYVNAFQSYVFNRALSNMITFNDVSKRLCLPGIDSKPCKYVKAELDGLGVEQENFRIPSLGLNIKGDERKTFMRINDLGIKSLNPLKICFRLDKGCYASILLNELCK